MKKLRFILFPFSILYYLITSARNFLFDKGLFKEHQFRTPIIVVGNLTVGGTGKTPQIEYLIKLLQDNYKIAVLSRGYMRKTKGFIRLNNNHKASDVGDEPLQYFSKFKNITVAVDENRVNGIQQLQKKSNPCVILLDDAYQHRKVKPNFSVLLTKYKDLFVNDFLLPVGNLRESRVGAQRCDVIIVTKCPKDLSDLEKKTIKKQLESYNKPVHFTSISYASNLKGTNKLSINNLKIYTVLLVTGIANPDPILNFLAKKEINFIHLKYKDHHCFSAKELKEIEQNFKMIENKNKIILTTEKDYMRLKSKINNLSFLPIETTFLSEKNSFNNRIISFLKTFKE